MVWFGKIQSKTASCTSVRTCTAANVQVAIPRPYTVRPRLSVFGPSQKNGREVCRPQRSWLIILWRRPHAPPTMSGMPVFLSDFHYWVFQNHGTNPSRNLNPFETLYRSKCSLMTSYWRHWGEMVRKTIMCITGSFWMPSVKCVGAPTLKLVCYVESTIRQSKKPSATSTPLELLFSVL